MMEYSFTVDRITDDGLLAGRNDSIDGNTQIPLGVEFTEIRKTRIDGDSSNYLTIDLGTVATICMELSEVHWYGKSIEAIPGGHTAFIKVKGEGFASLAEILKTKGECEYVHICSAPNT